MQIDFDKNNPRIPTAGFDPKDDWLPPEDDRFQGAGLFKDEKFSTEHHTPTPPQEERW